MGTGEKFKFKILWNLVTSRKWGNSYTPLRNVASGLPGDQVGACLEVARDLVKARILIPHKKGKCVSLNPKQKKHVVEFLESFEEE